MDVPLFCTPIRYMSHKYPADLRGAGEIEEVATVFMLVYENRKKGMARPFESGYTGPGC